MTARRVPWGPLLVVVCGGTIMGLALGGRHMQGLFLLPMTLDHGWSREAFGLAIAMQNLAWGVSQPLTGMIADRFGSGKVIFTGALAYAAGLYLMSVTSTPVAFNLTAGLLIGVALSGTAFGAVYGALSRIIAPERRSWALGMAGAIAGLGQFLVVPLAQGLIGTTGWARTLVIFAVMFLLLSPLAYALREGDTGAKQGEAGQSMSAAIREAFGHSGFWLLNLGFLACGFQLAFIATHLPAYLRDQGVGPEHAAMALALIALANVFGTYACGHLGGIYRRKHVLSLLYVLRAGAIALFLLLPLSPWTVHAFAIAMGLLWLGTLPLTNGLVSQVFGVRYIATLFGFVFFGHQLGAFLGVWLGALAFEATGSYDLIWLGSIGLGLLAALLHWPIDDHEIPRVAEPIVQN